MISRPGAARWTFSAALFLCGRAAASPTEAATAPVPWSELEVPGGIAALARAAGLPSHTEPWRLLSAASRRIHGSAEGTAASPEVAGSITAHFASLAASAPAPPLQTAAVPEPPTNGSGGGLEAMTLRGEVVPLPLPAETWLQSVFRGRVEAHRLLEQLLTDRNASLLYRGLMSLDAPTLAAVSDPGTLAAVYDDHATVFALLAPEFRVRDGRVDVPGGAAAAPAWEALARASTGAPAEFLLRLLRERDGALGMLYAALSTSDPATVAWLLALEGPPEVRTRNLQDLLRLVSGQPRWWRTDGPAARRPPADFVTVLATLQVNPHPPLALSRTSAWRTAFTGIFPVRPIQERSPVKPTWLLEQILEVPPDVGLDRLRAVAFTQRVFAEAPAGAEEAILWAAHGFRHYPALLLSLERIGVRDPHVYAAATGRAATLSAIPGDRGAVAVAHFQGTLAVIERAHDTGVLSNGHAVGLVIRLVRALEAGGDTPGTAGAWIRTTLVPALAEATGAPASAPAEDVVVRALAGGRAVAPPSVTVQWEGLRYRVDVAEAEARRIRAVRAAQGPPLLDDGLPPLTAVRGGRPEEADRLLAQALTGLAYAVHLQEPETGIADHAARRHVFVGGGPPPARAAPAEAWSLPREVRGTGTPWHVRGALLGLEIPLAFGYLRRADARLPAMPPRLEASTRQAFAETAALMNPYSFGDGRHRALTDALARGRQRIARAARDAEERRRLAALLEGARPLPLLEWVAARDPARFASLFTLADAWRAGAGEDAGEHEAFHSWGTVALRRTGCLCLRMPGQPPTELALAARLPDGVLAERLPDLNLRVAEVLAELELPAVLAPYVLRLATQHLIDELQPAYADDHRAAARYAEQLPRERIEDYVSTLATTVLVPVAE